MLNPEAKYMQGLGETTLLLPTLFQHIVNINSCLIKTRTEKDYITHMIS